jgi:sigma-B regulation protein RsbU (phosphoserine phosphatase)
MEQEKPGQLETLYRVSQSLSSSLDLDVVLDAVMDQVIEISGAERGFLMMGETAEELSFRVARGIDRTIIEAPEFEVSRGVLTRVADEGEPLVTDDAQRDKFLSGRESVSALNLRSIMCVPLKARGERIGVIYVDNRMHSGIFRPTDLELLQAVANTAAVAIENARLHQVAVERARLERELELARQIQTSLIPAQAPNIEGYEISGVWRAAREVAGDFYDFIPRADGDLAVVIGDVTDKGVPAALFMAHVRTTLRASFGLDLPLEECLMQANRLISADSSSGMFVTLCCLVVNGDHGETTFVSAGHHPPLLYRTQDDRIEKLEMRSFPLGIDPEHAYQAQKTALYEGDLILLYTDGVLDAVDEGLQDYGAERLSEQVHEHGSRAANEILALLERDIRAFTNDAPLFDDITLVGVKRNG